MLASRPPSEAAPPPNPAAARWLAGYYALLIVAWIGAWSLHDRTPIHGLSDGARAAYWTVAKALVWIAPVVLIVRLGLKQPVSAYLGLVRFTAGARVGLVVGMAFVALSAVVDAAARSHAIPRPSWGMLSALTVAPLFEELMFRGFALTALEESGRRFWPANAIAALLFLGLHLPGWLFMRSLGPSQLVVGLSVVVIGLVAGYARRRADSTWASVIVHFLNNAYAAFVR